jgi:colanic acid/amylovoran biosynthesis protein
MPRKLVIALPWHSYGHRNLGVDALTRAHISIIKAAAARIGREITLILMCSAGRIPAGGLPSGVALGPNARFKQMLLGRGDFLEALRQADMVLDLGEGDSWTDIYGSRRFFAHAGTKMSALMLGKPLVLAPQTIGPFRHPVSRWVSDFVMDRARAIFARDDLSSDYLASRGLSCETATYTDVAFRLPFEPQPKALGKLRVGLNVSGLLYQKGYTGRNDLGLKIDYAAYTDRIIEHFTRAGAEIHLIPHVSAMAGNDDDLAILPQLPPPFPDASAAKSYISSMDFVVAGRMHACIGAYSARVPVVPLAYSRKFNGLFGSLGYRHVVDGLAVGTQTAVEFTLNAFDNRHALARDIEPGLAIAEARLDAYEERLAAILSELG